MNVWLVYSGYGDTHHGVWATKELAEDYVRRAGLEDRDDAFIREEEIQPADYITDAEHHREVLLQALIEVLNYDHSAAEQNQAEHRASSVLDAVLDDLDPDT